MLACNFTIEPYSWPLEYMLLNINIFKQFFLTPTLIEASIVTLEISVSNGFASFTSISLNVHVLRKTSSRNFGDEFDVLKKKTNKLQKRSAIYLISS